VSNMARSTSHKRFLADCAVAVCRLRNVLWLNGASYSKSYY